MRTTVAGMPNIPCRLRRDKMSDPTKFSKNASDDSQNRQPPSGENGTEGSGNPMKKKLLIVTGIGLVGASASTFLFYQLIAGYFAETATLAPVKHSIVVAARDLPRGTRLSAGDVEVSSWKEPQRPEGAFLDARAVEGEVLGEAVRAAKPVLAAHLADKDQLWLAASVPPGMRAVTVHVNEFAGVTQLVQRGDRVDVMVANLPRSPGRPDVRLKTVLQNIEVAATGREPVTPEQRNPIPVVTLLVEAKEAERLTLADQSGAVRLALRNPLDESVEITGGPIRLSDVMQAAPRHQAAARSAKTPSAPAAKRAEPATSTEPADLAALRED